jgi:TRAP transporter 4TM/12TM fusion protein
MDTSLKDSVRVIEIGEEGSRLDNIRVFKGPLKIIISLLAISLSLFHLYTGAFGIIFVVFQRCVHIVLVSVLVFALYPVSKKIKGKGLFIIDMVLIALSIVVYIYPILSFGDWVNRQAMPNTLDLIFGGLTILLVLEASRRVIGPSISIVAAVFLLYAHFGPYIPGTLGHRYFPLSRIIEVQYMTTEGIFGIPLGVSSTFVFLFILFGAFIIKCGLGKFFTDISMSIAGGLPGGPAKIAVVASGFEGMISGSSVANVVGSGSVTIPLMKSIGYPAHFAGAVEATASTGGQFMPPVMGAGAFVMAEFLGVPYVRIALLAFIPACLYYFACYMQIHYRAVKMDLKGVPRAQLPKFWGLFKKKFYLLFPIVVLVYFLLNYYSILRVAFLAIVATIIVGLFQKGEDRFTLRSFFETLEVGARTALGVAVACACAGIVVGVITMTGLGLKISTVIIDLSHGILFITLVLSAIVCLIMGMGVPVTASYIIVATIAAPSLLKLGVMPLAAHLFVFYFAVLADITPPVCIAAYVAAGMAGANPMKTGLTATKLGIAAFIVPFVFCYDTALLGLGDVSYIIYRIIITMLGVIALAAGAEMYFLRKNKFYETPLLFVAALLLIKPGWITDLTGIIILSIVILLQFFRGKKETFVYSGLLIRFLTILFRKERE